MKVPVKWLGELVDIDEISVKELEDVLTMTGSKTEGSVDLSKESSNVVVGKILELRKHPGADKLQIVSIDVGEVIQIVTGATNISEGDYVPVALVGALLANGLKIKKGKLRGEVSNGMLCSLEELGYQKNVIPKGYDDGIYIFDKELPVGADVFSVTTLGDTVIEFEITPNRPDCLSMDGIALETSASFNKKLLKRSEKDIPMSGDFTKELTVEIEDFNLCSRYLAFAVKDIKIEKSPSWMQNRLMQAGVRPINNVVDITNYVMLEVGNPIHAFDLDLVEGGKIIVGPSKEGEKITTLDEAERKLEAGDILIRDAAKPIGLAGVMGGNNSEIGDNTKNIIVEVANFNKSAIRKTSKRLGHRTEASSRFEKGISTTVIDLAYRRLIELFDELEVGSIVSGDIDVKEPEKLAEPIRLNTKRVNGLLGTGLNEEEIAAILEKLDVRCETGENYVMAKPPARRLDLIKEIDLVEEVARIYGYEKLESTLPNLPLPGGRSEDQKKEIQTRETLRSLGYSEAVTFSFISPGAMEKSGRKPENQLRLLNPLSEEYSAMRMSLIPNALDIMVRNQKNGNDHIRMFEIGNVFYSHGVHELPVENKKICVYSYGDDFFDMKGTVESLLESLRLENLSFEVKSDDVAFHPGRCASVLSDGREIGIFGEIHPSVQKSYGLGERCLVAELDLDAIYEISDAKVVFSHIPKYPSITLDIAVLVKNEVSNAMIMESIKNSGGRLLESISLFDVYTGKQIEDGYKSLAYKMTFRSAEKTLTDSEIEPIYNKILKNLENSFEARRR